jgi:hypothetical protein
MPLAEDRIVATDGRSGDAAGGKEAAVRESGARMSSGRVVLETKV